MSWAIPAGVTSAARPRTPVNPSDSAPPTQIRLDHSTSSSGFELSARPLVPKIDFSRRRQHMNHPAAESSAPTVPLTPPSGDKAAPGIKKKNQPGRLVDHVTQRSRRPRRCICDERDDDVAAGPSTSVIGSRCYRRLGETAKVREVTEVTEGHVDCSGSDPWRLPGAGRPLFKNEEMESSANQGYQDVAPDFRANWPACLGYGFAPGGGAACAMPQTDIAGAWGGGRRGCGSLGVVG